MIFVNVIICCFVKQTIITGISLKKWLKEGCYQEKCRQKTLLYQNLARLNFLPLYDPEILYGPVTNLCTPTARYSQNTWKRWKQVGGRTCQTLFLKIFFNGWESTGQWFHWSSVSSPWKESENSDKMWQADSCSLWLLWKARQAVFVWWEMLWRKTDGAER